MNLMERPLSPAETAKRLGVSIKALRLYEKHGLVKPLRSRVGSTGSAWRSYGPDQIARLHQILALKRLGFSLARIGTLLKGPDTMKSVLSLQEQALAQDCARLSRALGFVHAARAKLQAGQVLSIDDLANLIKETSMASKLTRHTYFHPALVPHQHKHFRPDEIDALASREDFDQEREIAVFFGMINDLKNLTAAGHAGPQRRWIWGGDGYRAQMPSPEAIRKWQAACEAWSKMPSPTLQPRRKCRFQPNIWRSCNKSLGSSKRSSPTSTTPCGTSHAAFQCRQDKSTKH